MDSLDKLIPCPICRTPIPFNLEQLLRGTSFYCPQCGSRISMPIGTSEKVRQALEKLENLRQNQGENNTIY